MVYFDYLLKKIVFIVANDDYDKVYSLIFHYLINDFELDFKILFVKVFI